MDSNDILAIIVIACLIGIGIVKVASVLLAYAKSQIERLLAMQEECDQLRFQSDAERSKIMHSAKFTGELKFAVPPTVEQLWLLTRVFNDDFTFSENFGSVVPRRDNSGSAVVDHLNGALDAIWRVWPEFRLTGELLAQGDEWWDEWRLIIGSDGRAVRQQVLQDTGGRDKDDYSIIINSEYDEVQQYYYDRRDGAEPSRRFTGDDLEVLFKFLDTQFLNWRIADGKFRCDPKIKVSKEATDGTSR